MKKARKFLLWRDALGCTLLTCLVGGLLYVLFNSINFLSPIENAFRDFSYTDIYYSKLQDTTTKTSDIILVNVGNANRFSIALGIEKVAAQKPKAIGLDIIFSKKKNPLTDSILKKTIHKTPNTITAYQYLDSSIANNHSYFDIPIFKSGYLNLAVDDKTSVVRDFVGARIQNGDTLLAFPVQIAVQTNNLSKKQASKLLNQSMAINYFGGEKRYLSFELDDLISRDTIPVIKDSFVLFGYLGHHLGDSLTLEDKHFSPLNPKFAGRSFPDIYGLVIQANILEMLTSGQYIIKVPNTINWLLAFLGCWAFIALGMVVSKKSEFIFDLGIKAIELIATIVLLYITYVLVKYNIHLKIGPLLILSLLGLEMIGFYTYLIRYLKNRWSWKSYLLD